MYPTTFNHQVLDSWLDKGLCHGPGDGKNTVCVEQAIALSLGFDLTDTPEDDERSCIASSVASYKRALNDCDWSSPAARASGMRELAYEQLGSRDIDEKWFTRCLAELTIRKLLPKLFRQISETTEEPHKSALLRHADECEKYGTQKAAKRAAAWAAERAERTAAWATERAERTAAAVAEAARWAAAAKKAEAAHWAAVAARWAAVAAVVARWAAVAAAAAWSTEFNDDYLMLSANLALRSLREAKQRAGIPLFHEVFSAA